MGNGCPVLDESVQHLNEEPNTSRWDGWGRGPGSPQSPEAQTSPMVDLTASDAANPSNDGLLYTLTNLPELAMSMVKIQQLL